MIFSLIGAHRVGKTTLMRKVCEEAGSKPLEISIGKLQRELGYDSSNQSYDLDTRLKIQQHLVKRADEIFRLAANNREDVISDRSPMDIAAYTLLHANDQMTPEQSRIMMQIVDDCLNMTNKYIMGCLLVQPGIPLVKDNDTSAACAEGFIEKLSTICFGLVNDDRLADVPMFFIPRKVTSLEDRIKVVKDAIARSMARNITSGRLLKLQEAKTEFPEFFEATCKKQ